MAEKKTNKKVSGSAAERYWQRAISGNFAETHKKRRMARHGKTIQANAARVARLKVPRGTARQKARALKFLNY